MAAVKGRVQKRRQPRSAPWWGRVTPVFAQRQMWPRSGGSVEHTVDER